MAFRAHEFDLLAWPRQRSGWHRRADHADRGRRLLGAAQRLFAGRSWRSVHQGYCVLVGGKDGGHQTRLSHGTGRRRQSCRACGCDARQFGAPATPYKAWRSWLRPPAHAAPGPEVWPTTQTDALKMIDALGGRRQVGKEYATLSLPSDKAIDAIMACTGRAVLPVVAFSGNAVTLSRSQRA